MRQGQIHNYFFWEYKKHKTEVVGKKKEESQFNKEQKLSVDDYDNQLFKPQNFLKLMQVYQYKFQTNF